MEPITEELLSNDELIELDYYNSDLNIKSDVKWLISPENDDGFALMYGCIRSNFGLKLQNLIADRYSLPQFIIYQVMIKEYLPVEHLPFEEEGLFDLRVGWSSKNVKSIVGESDGSYAYCMDGRKASNSVFRTYGRNAEIGDIITVVLDIINDEISIFVNDDDLGIMFAHLRFNDQLSGTDYAIVHPHIAVKNLKAFVNFGVDLPDAERPWPIPVCLVNTPYKFFGDFSRYANFLVPTPRAPSSKSDCTVMFMVGLPAAGKSSWVESFLLEHSNEEWTVLSSEKILDLMNVNGISRQRIHRGRWDVVMGLAWKAANRALQLACCRKRNYIIDQTNVSRDARKRKLEYFQDFRRICVVLVPSDRDFAYRQMKQARENPNDQIHPDALLQLKGIFSLPETEHEPLEEVMIVEPALELIGDAIETVRRFNEEGRAYLQFSNRRRN